MERKALFMSLGLSLFAMYLVYQYVSNEEDFLNKNYNTFFPVVVSVRDILQYETIKPTDLTVIRVPSAMRPPGYISDPKDVIDAVAAIPIASGEQLLDTKLIARNIYSGLDHQISMGRRAISIPVNPKSAVGYMLRPGNRVDLSAHFEYRTKGKSISEVKIFLQDLLVLAVGRTIQPEPPRAVDYNLFRKLSGELPENVQDNEQFRETLNYAKKDTQYLTVTLEVSPTQAQQIVYVMAVYGDSIQTFLRHSDDRALSQTDTTNLTDVMGPESYYSKSQKDPLPLFIPKPKYYDYVGGREVGVY